MPAATVPAPGLAPLPERLRCGRFEVRPLERRLLDAGTPAMLGGRAFDLLLALLQRPGRVVPRHELIDAVWPGLVVEENNLSVQVNALRKALGNDVLVTVPGRGYRLAACFEDMAAAPLADAPPAVHASTAPAAVPAPAAATPRTRLPTAQPLLVGRSEDLAALNTLVEQHRLVTLVGAGGIGKTRLAQALLQLHEGRHGGGVCWVELGAVTDAAALPGAVATALGVRPAAGPAGDHGAAGLAQALAGLQLLVGLDNAEHLLADVAALAQALLSAAPGLRLLVTSQAPLKLAAERVLRLPGLAIPQGALPASQAQAFGAIGLFVERAQAADGRFVLADAQVPALIGLCRQLDGLPLAIELAAARVPVLGLDRLLAALPERLGLLTRNRDRHAPPRQQTLRAALQWSHDLLGTREQRLFRALAVVAGTASLALVQALASGDQEEDAGADPWVALDALDELVQRSLVEVSVEATAGGGTAEPRYRLLESPRMLALELLAASGEAPLLRARHARALLQQFDEAERAMQAGELGVEAWRQQGELDIDNAREALAWTQAAGDAALWRALATVALPRLPAALHEERLRLADALEPLIDAAPQAAARRRAWSALSAALVNARPQRSRAAALRALAEARAAHTPGDAWPLYHALCDAVDVLSDEAGAAAAAALLQEAQALEDPSWPPVRLRDAVRVQASIAVARGQATEALGLYRRMLALGLAAGDPSLGTQINLADIALWAGDAQAAVDSGRALVTHLSAMREEVRLAYARVNLAAAWLALGRPDEARPVLQQAWPATRRVERQAWCTDYVALLAALEGRHEDAAQLLGAADARYTVVADIRQVNESRAEARCTALARAALGDAAFEALRVQGGALDEQAVDELAWQMPPAPGSASGPATRA